MRAWASQTQTRSIMVFWPKIVLLCSLDLKIPKVVKKVVQTAFGVCLMVYNGRHCGLFKKKSYTNARVWSYRHVMLFFVYFPLIHNNLENIRQGNADL